jgi:hypothetical protein
MGEETLNSHPHQQGALSIKHGTEKATKEEEKVGHSGAWL